MVCAARRSSIQHVIGRLTFAQLVAAAILLSISHGQTSGICTDAPSLQTANKCSTVHRRLQTISFCGYSLQVLRWKHPSDSAMAGTLWDKRLIGTSRLKRKERTREGMIWRKVAIILPERAGAINGWRSGGRGVEAEGGRNLQGGRCRTYHQGRPAHMSFE